MSWSTRGVFLLLVLCGLSQVQAEVISFNGTAEKATLVTRVLPSDEALAPIELKLSISALTLDKASDGFHALSVQGLTATSQPGAPEVFEAGSLLAVPDGFDPVVEVKSGSARELADVVVRPMQPKSRCSGADEDGFVFDADLYRSGRLYPASLTQVEEVGQLQGLRLVRIAIHPVQMDLAKRVLKVVPELTLQVRFQRNQKPLHSIKLSRSLYQVARGAVVNGVSLTRDFLRPTEGNEILMVLVADELKESVTDFVAWKRAKGIQTEVVTASQAGGTKEKVKAFIKDYYESHDKRLSYLIFVGNAKTMPAFTQTVYDDTGVSDYPYSLLSDRTEIPDVLVGRVVAEKASDVKRQIDRWMEYEKQPEKRAEWYAKGSTIASDQPKSGHPTDVEYAEQIQEVLKRNTYSFVDQFYQGQHTAKAGLISSALEEGRTWLTYFGHGNGTAWGSTNPEDKMTVASVGKLKNENKLPFIIDIACLNTTYVKIPKCFGSAWVNQQSSGKAAGAVAFFGSSVKAPWHEPANMAVGVAKSHYGNPVTTLGGSILGGELYMVEKHGLTASTRKVLKWYNLFGDPSLVVRTGQPRAFEISHELTPGSDDASMLVKAKGENGDAFPGLLVAVSENGKGPLAIGKTDKTGSVELKFRGLKRLPPGSQLTVTGYNTETYQETL